MYYIIIICLLCYLQYYNKIEFFKKKLLKDKYSYKKNKKDLIILVIASTETDYYRNFIEYYWKIFIKYIKKNKLSIKVYLLFGKTPTNININKNDMIISNTEENLIPGV